MANIKIDPNKVEIINNSAVAVIKDEKKYLKEFHKRKEEIWENINKEKVIVARCSKCSDSCGDDFKTETTYKEEKNTGNRLKNILLQVYDMSSVDNLQISEIKALINNLIDEHIEESDG